MGWVDGERWAIRCNHSPTGPRTLPETGLVLMPLVAGRAGSIVDVAGSTMRRVGYPVPSMAGLGVDEAPAPGLEDLLGAPRAQILRALDCPISIGRLAEALRSVPSAATHHVGALEAAGLVRRDRCGRQVLVYLTPRGRALLALYQEIVPAHRAGRRGIAS